ncbi:MAG: ABC transporter permease [Paracoccaceae bacterium]
MIRWTAIGWLSHWRRQPGQLGLLVVGLALATALWSAVQALNSEARNSYDRAMDQLGIAGLAVLVPDQGTIPVARYVALRRAGWALAPVLEGRWRLKTDSVRLMGVDLLSHPALPALADAARADGVDPMQALRPPGRLFVAPDIAEELAGDPDMPPFSVTAQVPSGTVLADISLAETLLGKRNELTRLLVLPNQAPDLVPVDMLAPELRLIPARQAAESARLTDSFHLNLTAFGLLSFAVGLFIVHATIGLAFEQRRTLVRTLRALGTPVRLLMAIALAELLIMALVAGALGMVLGYLVAASLLPDVSATLKGLYGAPAPGSLTLRPGWVLSGLAMTLAGVLFAGGQSLWQMARLPLLATPGQIQWVGSATGGFKVQLWVGLGMIAAGILTAMVAKGLLVGFILMGSLMLGAALTLPWILSLILTVTARTAKSPVFEWIWADTRAQLPALSLALMALLLALATNIGVGTMVSSFRLTFTGWMDQRLSAELYVTARSDVEAEDIHRWGTEQGLRMLPIRWSETVVSGAPVRVYGVVDDATYRDHWPLIEAKPDVWDQVMTGRAVLVNEQLARRHDLWPGTSLNLSADWTLPVAGVYSDYGNPNGQAIASLDALLSRYPDIPFRQLGVRTGSMDAGEVTQLLRDRFSLPKDQIVDQGRIKRQSLAIFDKTFVVTAALNILTLGVAGFSILTSLLTIWRLRQPQLAPVWALGLTRVQLSRIELGRSVVLALLTALLAIPLGLVVAWVLLNVVNVVAFGWQLPMYVFPADWARLVALAGLAAIVAALIPAQRLMRMKPVDLLRVFSNER